MEELRKHYKRIVETNTYVAEKALSRSDKAIEEIRKTLHTEILKCEEFTPHGITENIVRGKYRTVLEANVALAKALAKYSKVKEIILIHSAKDIKSPYSQIRFKRDTLQARFMTDEKVISSIKTIKHQEVAFTLIFEPFLDAYNRLKQNLDRLAAMEEYITQGFYTLNAMGKFVYNQTFQEGQEMAALNQDYEVGDERIFYGDEEAEDSKPKRRGRRKRKAAKKDLEE